MTAKFGQDPGGPLSDALIAVRDRWHCAHHPFYDRLAEGELELRHLGEFLVQHFVLVRQIFRSIGVSYAKAPDDIAHFIVENLAEEAGLIGMDSDEGKDHVGLILAFTRHCGIADDEVRSAEPLPTWLARAAYFRQITESDSAAVRMAVQATTESQLVAENERAVAALCRHYGFTRNSPEIEFFVEHATADIKHGNVMFGLAERHITTPEARRRALLLAERTCRLRWVSFNELYCVTVLGEEVGQMTAEIATA